MNTMAIIKIVIAISTIGFGLMSVISPSAAEDFTGISADGPRGVSEIRSVLGGLFVGLGAATLIYQTPSAYGTLGIGYLAIAGVRAGSMIYDKDSSPSNWWSLGYEVVAGSLLLF